MSTTREEIAANILRLAKWRAILSFELNGDRHRFSFGHTYAFKSEDGQHRVAATCSSFAFDAERGVSVEFVMTPIGTGAFRMRPDSFGLRADRDAMGKFAWVFDGPFKRSK